MVGRTISHYRVVSQLGSGGMGVVYRAEDTRLGRAVAIKFVSDDYAHDASAVARLRSEARAASALNHANICTIYDVGEDEGRPFIVMELLRGVTLRERLLTGPLRVHQLVDIGIEIADALHSTHTDGIIHRDIKPGNIFLTERGHVKVLDFGLAKLTPSYTGSSTTNEGPDPTVAGVTLGTIAYMSPEQATGEGLDGRTDLFSLGVVLYECATGRHPFPGRTSAVILSAILNRAPVPAVTFNPELPVRLQEIINNCLEKDRELRYQSAADLRADLKRLRRDIESGHSRPLEVGVASAAAAQASGGRAESGRLSSSLSRLATHPARATGTAVAAVSLLGAGMWALWPPRIGPEAAPAAQPPVVAVLPAAVQDRLALAASSLQARNYRAALAYATEVLAADPGHREAGRIRDEASAMLARFDRAIAEARDELQAGDVTAVARALETARELDPSAPAVIELTSRLADLVRERQASARLAVPREAPGREPAPRQAQPPKSPSEAPARSTPRAAPGAATPSAERVEQPSPPAAVPSPSPVPATPPAPAPPPVSPATPPVSPATPPAPAATPPRAEPPRTEPPTSPPPRAETPSRPAPAADADDQAIRELVRTYGRAIEAKDLALFRTVKPNLSASEERRLREGFRSVSSQQVTLTVVSIQRRGESADVVVRRRDVVEIGGRRETVDSQQTLSVERAGDTWVITEIR